MEAKNRRIWPLIVLLSVFAVVAFGTFLPMTSRRTNCGGNSAAMAACSDVGAALAWITSERGTNTLHLATLSEAERKEFKSIAGLSWLGNATVLINPRVDFDSTNDVVLAICNRAYRNVPQKLIGQAPPTHAALIHNRGVVLLPVEEFNRLNLDGFVNVRELSPKPEHGLRTLGERLDE
jgi:hypothetical protein